MIPGIDPKVDYAFKKVFGSESNARPAARPPRSGAGVHGLGGRDRQPLQRQGRGRRQALRPGCQGAGRARPVVQRRDADVLSTPPCPPAALLLGETLREPTGRGQGLHDAQAGLFGLLRQRPAVHQAAGRATTTGSRLLDRRHRRGADRPAQHALLRTPQIHDCAWTTSGRDWRVVLLTSGTARRSTRSGCPRRWTSRPSERRWRFSCD